MNVLTRSSNAHEYRSSVVIIGHTFNYNNLIGTIRFLSSIDMQRKLICPNVISDSTLMCVPDIDSSLLKIHDSLVCVCVCVCFVFT